MRSPRPSRMCAARARCSAVALAYRSTMERDFQPASRMRSPSVPPAASHEAANEWRSWWGCRPARPTEAPRSETTWKMPEGVMAPLRPIHRFGNPACGWPARFQLALGDRPTEEGLEAAVAVVGGGGLPAGELVGDEQLDMLARERADRQGMAVGGAELRQQPHRVGVRLDGAVALVLRPEGAAEARVERRQVRPGRRRRSHVGKL